MKTRIASKLPGLALALGLAFSTIGPAAARPAAAVQDGAHVLSQDTVRQVQQIDDQINRATGKDVLVVTEPSLEGSPQQEASNIFRREGLNGVLILMVPDKKVLGIVPGRSTQAVFPHSRLEEIRQGMVSDLRANRVDAGVISGVEGVRDTLTTAPVPRRSYAPAVYHRQSSSFGFGGIVALLMLFAGLAICFTVLRGLIGLFTGRSQGAYGGYGGGPGYYPPPASGGGGFLGNLAAGVGGAFLGNALYDTFAHRPGEGGEWVSTASSDPGWTASDNGAAGGADFGSGGADWGSSGGDFGSGGGDWG